MVSKHPGGRPLKFQSVDELSDMIDAYFEQCDKDGDPYTITGLALALDTSRESLLEYQDRPEFVDTIKRAKLKCHNYAEKFLYNGKNATGAIFNLKNNWGWRDKSEIDARVETVTPILGGASKENASGDISDDKEG